MYQPCFSHRHGSPEDNFFMLQSDTFLIFFAFSDAHGFFLSFLNFWWYTGSVSYKIVSFKTKSKFNMWLDAVLYNKRQVWLVYICTAMVWYYGTSGQQTPILGHFRLRLIPKMSAFFILKFCNLNHNLPRGKIDITD